MRHAALMVFVATFAALTTPPLAAQTEVGGLICTDTTWTCAESPYVVTSSILIGCDATLTIEPCVEVRFQNGLGLSVGHEVFGGGTLVARGTAEDRIVFTSNDPFEDPNDPNDPPGAADPGDWARIYFTDPATDAVLDPNSGAYLSGSVLEYVTVEYSGAAGPAISATNCSPYLAYCQVHDNASTGISATTTDAGDLIIEHCVIQDNSGNGIGINASSGGAVTIESCTLDYNTPGRGIGITASGTWPARIENCEISNSTVDSHGGGIYLTGGADHIVRGNRIENCRTTGGSNKYGGGMMIWVRTTIEGNTVIGNWASRAGGGICLWENSDGSTLSGNSVTGNAAGFHNGWVCGGGIHLYRSSSTVLTENEVTGNWTTHQDGRGGGIGLYDSDNCTLSGNTVNGNSTSGSGARGGGVQLRDSTGCLMIDNTISANSTSGSGAHGGGIYLYASGWGTIESNSISDNTTTGINARGGGIYLESNGNTTLESNTMTSNHASGANGDGGGICLISSGSCPVTENTITYNTCGDDGGGMYLNGSGNCTITANFICHNTCGDQGGALLLWNSPNCSLSSNEIRDNAAGNVGALFIGSSSSCTMSDSVILGNQAMTGTIGGIYVTTSPSLSLAGDPNEATYNIICSNDGYCLYNDNANDGGGANDIDARYVAWGTSDIAEIQDCIYDFFDDAGKSFVLFFPYVERLPGDCNGDWRIDLDDLACLLGRYGSCDGDAVYDAIADFDDSGCIDLSDLAYLLGVYGFACP